MADEMLPEDADPILGVAALESAVLRIKTGGQEVERRAVSFLKGGR